MNELTQLMLLSLWCHGWHYLLSPGEALYFLSKWAYKDMEKAKAEREQANRDVQEWKEQSQYNKLDPEMCRAMVDIYNEKIENNTEQFERKIYFLKPLFLCSICFASIYGTGGYLLLNYTTWGIFPVSVIALISVNKIFQRFL